MVLQVVLLLFVFFNLSVCSEDDTFLNVKSEKTFSFNFKYGQEYALNITLTSNTTRSIVLYAISQGSLVSISLKKGFPSNDSTTGASAAMIKLLKRNDNFAVFYLHLKHNDSCASQKAEEVIDILAIELSSKDPLPGGCNLVYQPDFYPVLNLTLKRLAAQINYQPSNVGYSFEQKEPICDQSTSSNKVLLYDVYVEFLSDYVSYNNCCIAENNNTEDFSHDFQNTIQNHTTSSMTKLLTHRQNQSMQFFLAFNPCVNMAVYVNVKDPEQNGSSFYAPLIIGRDNCIEFNIFIQLFSVLLCLSASVLCLIGHRIFAFELFMFGSLLTFIICFIIFETTFDDTVLFIELSICTGFAILFGIIFVALWWRFGYAQLYCIFIAFVSGFLLASIVFSTPIINNDAVQFKTAFVCLFLSVILVYFILMGFWPSKGCIVSSAFVGSYLAVFSLSSGVFLCSGISFIVPFSLLRFTDARMEFSYVIFSLTISDIAVIGSWSVLFVLGCLIQFYLMKNRPGFPECPYKSRTQWCRLTDSSIGDVSSDDSDSLSSRGPSYTAENYDGDVSDDMNEHVISSSDTIVTSDDTAPLCG